MSTADVGRERQGRVYNEDKDDEDYAMPHRYDNAGQDKEISLGTGTVLALFLALALVCSVFFGMGYTMGRKSTPPVTVASVGEGSGRSLSDAFKAFKPAPGSPGKIEIAAKGASAEAVAPSPSSVVVSSDGRGALVAGKKQFDPDAEIVETVDPAPKTAAAVHAASAAVVPATPVAGLGTAMVQVAAVSHQEDADMMLAALKRKGYSVAVHHEPQDKLLHLQLGPYPSKKDADAMRLRLQADGYNAILK